MKKLLLLFAVMLSAVGAWAQAYQKVPHTKWTVTAPNQSSTSGNEGGVAFIKDENPSTFYHSDWGGTQPGKNGLQGFLIDMAEEMTDIYKITYTGRSDNNTSGWAIGVKIYMYNTLPDGLPADLSTLSHEEKETLFCNATVLGTPAFDNTESPWANDRTLKTATFTEAKTARYVLFVMHSGNDAWLTCSDFHVWQKVDGIVEDKPYFLKITNAAGEGEWYLDTHTPIGDTQGLSTIGKSANSVATYFSLVDGYWNISTKPGCKGDFVSVSKWCAPPQSAVGAGWTVVKNSDGTMCLKQHDYLGGNDDVNRTFLGGDVTSNDGVVKVFTDNDQEKAVKIELVELSEFEAAKETARLILSKTGVGYPALESEARTTLQAAIDAQDATAESVNDAVTVYNAVSDVVMPEAGKVYRFVSANPNFYSNQKVYKALYSDNGELKWKNLDATAMNQLWSVENVSGVNITFYNVQDATYPQNSAFSSAVRMLNVKNEGSLVFLGKGQFKIQPNKLQGIHANGHGNGTGNNGNAINYNTDADGASAWYIEEVAVTKEILAAQINAVRTAYIGSLLIKEESIAGLSDAVDAAQAVYDENGNYAQALASLAAAVKEATIEYIDLGYFYMKSKAAGKYAYNDNTALKVTDSKVLKGIFKFTKAKNGTFYVQNGNGFYAQGVNTSQLVQTSSMKKAYHVNKMPSGHYVLRPEDATGTHNFLHDANNGTGDIVGWSTAADNTQWTFEVLSEEELAKIYTVNMSGVGADAYVTYNGTYEGGAKDVKANGGFYVLDSSPAVEDFTVNGVTDGLDSKVFVSGRDITVVEGYDSENIYIIRSKNNSSYARYHSGSKMSAEDETNMLTYENNNLHWESLFYIEEGAGDYAGYYTIRPVSAPNLYVYNLESVDRNSAVATKERPTEGDLTANYYWKISTFGAEYANITPHGTDDCGWNKRGSYNGYNHIGYWKGHNNADDNKWIVRKVEEELIPYTTDDSALGLVTYESAQPMLPYIKLVTSENLSKVKGTKFDVVAPKQGEFYRLKNQVSNRYMTAESNAVKVYDECNDQSTIFYVDADNTLLSYAFGRYLDCGNKVLATVGTKYNGTFAKKCGVSYLPNVLAYNNNGAWTYGNRGNGESIDRGTGNEPTTDEGYNWVFEPVTTLPVTITSAGYATFYCPVAVTLPEGLQAFYVSETTDNYAKMTEIAGVIPANTGVILQGAENTYNLTIGGSAGEVDNELSGTVASEYVTTESYVLSKQNDVVGFYKATMNQQENTAFLNNGFKAYLPATAGGEARFLVFNFGDDNATAIEGIEAENTADAVVYDLAGRRVQKAQKGLYIVNGKKVIK